MARLPLIFAFVIFTAFAFARDLDAYRKEKFVLGGRALTLWIADSNDKRQQGLMHIEKMSEDVGMLFVFDEPQPLAFWMKNTIMPLAIAYLDDHGKIIDIQEMSVPSVVEQNPPAYQSRDQGAFALEMNKGWFDRHHIKVGAQLARVSDSPNAYVEKRVPLNKKSRH